MPGLIKLIIIAVLLFFPAGEIFSFSGRPAYDIKEEKLVSRIQALRKEITNKKQLVDDLRQRLQSVSGSKELIQEEIAQERLLINRLKEKIKYEKEQSEQAAEIRQD